MKGLQRRKRLKRLKKPKRAKREQARKQRRPKPEVERPRKQRRPKPEVEQPVEAVEAKPAKAAAKEPAREKQQRPRSLRSHPETRGRTAAVIAAVLILLFALVGAAAYVAFFTDTLRIRQVIVTGNQNLTVDYVKHMSGIDSYKNLITLPAGRISKNLEQDPWVKKAVVSRKFLHTVKIAITERQPMAMLDTNGAGFLVDDGGYVITRSPLDEFKQLPRLDAGDISLPRVGTRVSDKRIQQCVEVMRQMSPALRATIQQAHPLDARGQVFTSNLGFEIIYGQALDVKKKNEILEAVMQDVKNNGRKAVYVDVRVIDSPVIKVVG